MGPRDTTGTPMMETMRFKRSERHSCVAPAAAHRSPPLPWPEKPRKAESCVYVPDMQISAREQGGQY